MKNSKQPVSMSRQVSKEPRAASNGLKQKERFSLIDSKTFATSIFTKRQWIAENLLVRDQLGVIGGPQKCLKTGLVIDIAVSLGLGMPVLGEFKVPVSLRVAVFSGESGQATILDAAERMCAVRGKSLADCDVFWNFDLPKFGDAVDVDKFTKSLSDNSIEVVFIDPLYLCLTGGGKSVSPTNLYDVGPAVKSMADACLSVGATPIIVHHTNKTASRPYAKSGERRKLGLHDLAFSGIGEMARQWIILDRLEEFSPTTGRHRLRLHSGGSAGHSGEWEVEISEGVLKDDFTGRHWRVSVDGRQTLEPKRRIFVLSARAGENTRFRSEVDDDDDDDGFDSLESA